MDISLQQVAEVLGKANKVVLSGHSDPDGDAVGAMLGLAHLLTGLGKQVWLYREGPLPVDYAFLPGTERITESLPPSDWADMLIILDCHQVERAGSLLPAWLPPDVKVLVLDHHLGDTAANYLVHKDPGYSATSELVALMLHQAGWHVGVETAMCLYAGLIGDTGNFTQGNTTARVLNVAGWLVERGARPEELSLFSSAITHNRLRLHGYGLEKIQSFFNGRLFVTSISKRNLLDYQCGPADLEGLVEPLRFIEGGLIVALLKELGANEFKVSLRSRRHVDVSGLAQSFGGGGHKNAAGFKAKGTFDSVLAEFLRRVQLLLEEIGE